MKFFKNNKIIFDNEIIMSIYKKKFKLENNFLYKIK